VTNYDASYGTYDHLILVLGRLANFASRDLDRKRQAFRAKGTFGPSGAPPGTFPGMMPTSDHVPMPRGFSPLRDEGSSPKSDSADEQDFDDLTAAAYREWEGIQVALEAFRSHLGADFEPLAPDVHPVSMTPFGPALRYRTYSIAGIWMNYYMGMINLHRAHPEMPPVAMMAAGMSAKHTMKFAMDIARIAHGLEENAAVIQEVSTLVSASFIESAFCLFVAAVQVCHVIPIHENLPHLPLFPTFPPPWDKIFQQQSHTLTASKKQYQSDAQRHWLIQHLHHIARLTGWQSARQIADGCESAWARAAAAGRGPPYTRSSDLVTSSSEMTTSVWGNPRRIDRRIQEMDDDTVLVLAKEEKAHYALGIIGVQEDMERLDLETADKAAE
jgi:hypothetical protein